METLFRELRPGDLLFRSFDLPDALNNLAHRCVIIANTHEGVIGLVTDRLGNSQIRSFWGPAFVEACGWRVEAAGWRVV